MADLIALMPTPAADGVSAVFQALAMVPGASIAQCTVLLYGWLLKTGVAR